MRRESSGSSSAARHSTSGRWPLRKSGGGITYVELAGDDIGDEARPVFTDYFDFMARLVGCSVQRSRTCLYSSHDEPLFACRCEDDRSRTNPINIKVALCIHRRLAWQFGPHRSEHAIEEISLDPALRNKSHNTVWETRLKAGGRRSYPSPIARLPIGILRIVRPAGRILRDVLSNVVQGLGVPDDVVVIAALPDRGAAGVSQFVDSPRRCGFVRTDDCTKGMFRRSGWTLQGRRMRRPCVWRHRCVGPRDQDHPMHMIGHDDPDIRFHQREMGGQLLPHRMCNFPDIVQLHLSVHDFAEQTAAVSGTDGHEVCALPGIVEVWKTDRAALGRCRGDACVAPAVGIGPSVLIP